MPLETKEYEAPRPRVEPQPQPQPQPQPVLEPQPQPQPVLEPPTDLKSAYEVLNRSDFRQACSREVLKKLLRIKEVIDNTADVQPAQVQLLVNHVSCEVNGQLLNGL